MGLRFAFWPIKLFWWFVGRFSEILKHGNLYVCNISVCVKFQPISTILQPNGPTICVFGPIFSFGVSWLNLFDLKNMATCILIIWVCVSSFSPFRQVLDPMGLRFLFRPIKLLRWFVGGFCEILKHGNLYVDNIIVCVKFQPITTFPRPNGLGICHKPSMYGLYGFWTRFSVETGSLSSI